MLPSPKTAVRRVLLLLVLTLLLPAVLPAAGVPTEPAKPTASFWSPVGDFWKTLVHAACDKGISIDPNGCPAPSTTNGCDKGIGIDPDGCPRPSTANGCDKGSSIDPNSGCAH
jgi:hypothetical protein